MDTRIYVVFTRSAFFSLSFVLLIVIHFDIALYSPATLPLNTLSLFIDYYFLLFLFLLFYFLVFFLRGENVLKPTDGVDEGN